jgi:peptide/nickel transport system permease protein
MSAFNRLTLLGMIIVLFLCSAALFAPFLAPHSPTALNLDEGLRGPTTGHLLGQDKLGRDILSRIIYGSRVSLKVGVLTVGISLIIGLIIGSIAGYCGGFIDDIIMRIIDIFMAFPGILLAIAIMAVLGPSLNNVIIALCLLGWVSYARLVRGQILSVKEFEFVIAARALGAGSLRIISRHLLPNILSPVIIQATFGMAGAIVAEAGLSFLGLGTQPPTPSWGAMLNEGMEFILVSPYMTIFPGLAIMIVVLGFNFLGDGIRDILDPKFYERSH